MTAHRPWQVAVLIALVGAAGGCAQVGERDALGNPMVLRATPEQLGAAQQNAVRPLTLEDLVTLTGLGLSPEAIMQRYRASGSRLRLTNAQAADLAQRGVDPRTVGAVFDAERDADRTDRVTAEVDRERAARARAEQAAIAHRAYRYYDPYYSYYPRFSPYGGYGGGPGARGWYGGMGLGF